MVYLALFFSAFVSATLIPLGSEALLVYDASQGYSYLYLLLFATVGNTLGAVVNYWLGLGGEELLERRSLIQPNSLKPAKRYFDRYGVVMLLLSWTPFIGDMFTFAAGVLRYRFWKFFVLVLVAKAGRYVVLLWGWKLFA